VRLLPFLFILYIANYLDRTSVAYAALGMSRDLGFSGPRVRHGSGSFLRQLRGLADPRRAAGGALERAADDFRNHDRLGIGDGADSVGAHAWSALYCAVRIRRAEAGFFPA